MESCAEIVVEGERLVLLPDRAVYWPARRTLLVADVHFGKAAALRSRAIPVPAGTTSEMLRRLSVLLDETRAHRLVMLGDLWHAKEGRVPTTLAQVQDWRMAHETVDMVLVEGNHDLRSGRLPQQMKMAEVDDCLVEAPFVFRHHPKPSEEGYVLCGHVHPCVTLSARGRSSRTWPCFWFAERAAVLPAFGEFTGCAKVRPLPGDSVFVIADNCVVRVGNSEAGVRTS